MTALRIAQSRIQASLKPASRLRMVHSSSPFLKQGRESSQSSEAGPSRIPIIRTLEEMRAWRREARDRKLDVGIVPTMGALHEGHLNLVRTSLANHPLTVMTLFVNPMQFAPTEDLSKYPRTLARDLELLSTLLPSISDSKELIPEEIEKSPLVIFNPSEEIMYPLRGNLQDLSQKRGVEVDVKGWGDVMEGASRPQFFKGVATVCTKLFNAVEPDHAYFGQKDIQQALLLRIMLKDLLISHPTPENMHIIPTTRDPSTNLALSSRNAYLTPQEMEVAPVLYRALSAAKEGYSEDGITGEELIQRAISVVEGVEVPKGVDMKVDYFEVFDKETFEPVRGQVGGREVVIAGAVWVGKTRLIDNLLLGRDM